MSRPHDRSLIEASGTAWPALVDLMTATLMVFLLVGFLQTILRADALEAALAKAAQEAFLDVFEEEFAAELERGTVAVERHLDYVQIVFSDRILFSSGDHRLQSTGRRILRRCARVFRSVEGFEQIQVDGHTDSLPVRRSEYPSDNWELSSARAISVLQFLTDAGLPVGVFSANGYADQRPVASNATAAGRARNRRIELRLFLSKPIVSAEEGS